MNKSNCKVAPRYRKNPFVWCSLVEVQLNETIIHKSLREDDFWQGAAAGALGSFGGSFSGAAGITDFAGIVGVSTVMGGVGSVIAGARSPEEILFGMATGVVVGALNHWSHHTVFIKNKERAYKYMIAQSISNKHEVAAVELEDRNILVFKEQGNKYDVSINYFVDKDGKTFVNVNGKLVRAIHQIHTHPGYYSNDITNPLNVSKNDFEISTRFNNEIRILMIQ
jgi:hypothetical protein